ncbi:MAG: V-type ATP synthase subunit C [Negativibacillus massiliensis]|uniref:V-type ATP synthase subunit C n=1 Tax=Negativibacillus massiliensis TaxID=1871035 RepID=UPI00033E5286|nr:V-type ATP synthase subunit C [Negativibacillus massiliensis]MBS5138675.1 V-type ATP synthase subunit C [Clostridium sp.]MCI6347480.1 V-type ATP synthase subunit C [Negativibacillus massiliensis]MDY4047275.1 V-type ATP synthase subunit C [Negativibacillus massiliensis]CDA77307.1 putative ATP synthase subunit C [Clostridium sp. CAG:242]
MKKTKDTEYLYLSANIRAQETRMIGTQALHKMISAATAEEAYKTVTDAGIGVDYDYRDFESALTQELSATYERLEKASPNPEMFKIFRYKYDGHNLKTLIKAHASQSSVQDQPEDLMIPLGTVDAKTLVNGLRDGDFGALEPKLAEAAIQARDSLAKLNDPQLVDVIIDRAVLESMSALAKQYKSKFLTRLVDANIDIANIRSFIRIKRIGQDLHFLKEVLAQGGSIPTERYFDLFLKSFDDFFEMLDSTPYGPALSGAYDAVKNKGTLSNFEKLCDNFMVSVLKESRFIPFGIEPVLSYLVAKENESQAIRIVMASKIAGVDPDKITERLRDTYA